MAGHTDNLPIKTARFPSNWELSTGRAVEVAKLLAAGGMKPELVGAAGYAEFAPLAGNETPEGRAQNRRIEIILEPNLSDLPNLESLLSEGGSGERAATRTLAGGAPPVPSPADGRGRRLGGPTAKAVRGDG